jgi:membrane protease YdiL (CAAX protease family)
MSIFGEKNKRYYPVLIGFFISAVGLFAFWAIHHISISTMGVDLWAMFRSPLNEIPLWAILWFAVILGPFCEEMFFRCYLSRLYFPCKTTSYEKKLSRVIYFGVITSTCFALLHLNLERDLMSQWPLFLVWVSCGLMCYGLYIWQKSILTPWILHACANAVILWPSVT